MTELRDNVPFLLVNTHRSGIIPSSALSTLTISCYHQETILGLQKYKGVLFIELTHENFQLHHLHISFLKKKVTKSDEHAKLSTSPILSHWN